MIKIAPSILSADFSRLGEEVGRLETEGADWVHVDVMDGVFVPNITIGPAVVKAIRPCTSLPFDVHLMITSPERYIEQFADAGADYITVHVEATEDVKGAIDRIHSLGKKAGLSLNPETPFTAVEPYLEHIDLLLVMTVRPGFGGQSFMPVGLPKIAAARERFDAIGSSAELAVDGGINRDTGRECIDAGVSVLAAGSALFKSPDMRAEMELWRAYKR
ncbi:MAG: ribulose-phosphate 3-epimerase [Methanomassiliicoccaceae archaeon]|jgi:ribulose-phosphate 3-epimerase|nr:ribulose-phosphate 3-epimerase [Euryarchaeota archaeon]HOB37440.1 ribulose-phosphate 3-epimerase [Methanomassiliicoccaceae archaeon]HPP45336.1 ribulose-phosphate 3-epimerase [Methanomassiliicoccaceae archaeon]HQA21597.1 ribulose-phosphate 3-epimerase [Methanomassiliicoccaceae archaeon]HQD87783.1 ribulose-phosphate 3-epimerase [Methanomassiliicoccaceae archaeon]